MAPDVVGDRIVRDERTRQHEPESILDDDVGGAARHPGFRPRVGERLEAEGRTVEVRGLLRIADVEFEVIEFKRVEHAGMRGGCNRCHNPGVIRGACIDPQVSGDDPPADRVLGRFAGQRHLSRGCHPERVLS